MARLRIGLLWLVFISGLVGAAYVGLDTFGWLPHQAPQLDKVSDITTPVDDGLDGRKRFYLIKKKTVLESRLASLRSSDDRAKEARAAMERGCELFAKKDYDGAEREFKDGLACLSRSSSRATATVPPTAAPTARATPTVTTPPPPTAPTAVVKALEKELEELEKRLNAVTDPTVDTDEAWLLMDRAFNAIRAGDVRNAKYFLTEVSIKIDNLTP